MAYRCQVLYLPMRQCRFETVRGSDICRWHSMMRILHNDLARMSPRVPHWLVAGGGLGLYSFLSTVRGYAATDAHPVVLLMAIWSLTTGIVFFCDGIIGMGYTLSHFPSLGRTMAWAMAVAVVTGFTFAVVISALGPESAPAIALLSGARSDWFARNGHLVAAPVVALFSLSMAAVFMKSVLERKLPMAGWVGWMFVLASAGPLVQTFQDRIGFTVEKKKSFWEAALGENASWVSGIAFTVGFLLCEFINVAMRRRECTTEEFRATVSPSFGACFGPPMLSLLLVAWIFRQTGFSSSVVFVIATAVVSIVICRYATRMVIRSVQTG